ncbi:expressed unknown protein [Seminavis robusta]|uniref:Uncharacterized protein n=1 Tax=Seminavis robusta TaxID=568900 RepID=A0A9N8HPE5_9STRA|nr:expressed unknown protein [Seminavis robusta]|eukprot:Sro1081_g239050.1 n/a (322) ;mRNA; f:8877-9842
MARASYRESTGFVQEHNRSNVKFVLASAPLAVVMIFFVYEAYHRPEKPFYNIPSYVTDDAVLRKAAEDSGSFVPLMDMCYVMLSFCVAWACLAGYFLGFLAARRNIIERYLDSGKPVRGNVVYEHRCWAFEFRYYGYCSYQHPDPASDPNIEDLGESPIIIRKRTRIFEPYTRELVPILCLPGYPMSGQGKDDVEFANINALKNKSREVFLGWFCLAWTVVCAAVPIYILHQMSIIVEREYYAGISDNYDNPKKGWAVYWLFIGIGVLGGGVGGNALAWMYRRWWILHQGSAAEGDLSVHGVSPQTGNAQDYVRMSTVTRQ